LSRSAKLTDNMSSQNAVRFAAEHQKFATKWYTTLCI